MKVIGLKMAVMDRVQWFGLTGGVMLANGRTIDAMDKVSTSGPTATPTKDSLKTVYVRAKAKWNGKIKVTNMKASGTTISVTVRALWFSKMGSHTKATSNLTSVKAME